MFINHGKLNLNWFWKIKLEMLNKNLGSIIYRFGNK